MTEPESPEAAPEAATNVTATAEAPEPAPAPEPWTPERVTEWNRYYDLYVALGVLLLVFVVSANKIVNPVIWTQLRAGQVIASRLAPVTTDHFSYTEEGRRWVNIPWLYEWGHYLLYKFGYDRVYDKANPGASIPRADQVGAGVLVAADALARFLAALVLLRIRRAGPGLWWSVVCVMLALGAMLTPSGIALGGIAGPGQVAPGAWGLLLLALELLLLHHALNLGHARALWGLVPLFLLWANVDESFVVGLAILAAGVVGLLERPAVPKGEHAPPTFGRGLAVLAACAAVCLANPSLQQIYGAAIAPFFAAGSKGDIRTTDQLSLFSREFHDTQEMTETWRSLVLSYLIVVGVGIASFAVNLKRFSLSRFLVFATVAAIWALRVRYSTAFAVVFAVTVALNGQEWYHARFGTRGRLGRGWALWSVGGRAVTILALFYLVARGLTGYGGTYGEMQFGFGYNPDNFDFEAADYLKNARLQGKVFNTTRRQGDALLWRAFPERQAYIDNRHNLFPQSLINEQHKIRLALKTDETAEWKPLLDKYGVSVVMLDELSSRDTYKQLMQSVNWVPFHDDGNIILFGRADAAPGDLAHFKANRLDAEALAYRRTRPVPPVDRPPTRTDWMDQIFQGRTLTLPQPHTAAAERWLTGLEADLDTATLPDPAHCLMAIREARTALSHRPDDPLAFRLLAKCYRDLMVQETALLQGLKLTPETVARLAKGVGQPLLLMSRFRQRVTTLNFAIQTTPPPRSSHEWAALRRLHFELFQLYASASDLDLARDQLQHILELSDKAESDQQPEEVEANRKTREQLGQQLEQLEETVKKVQDQINERQEGPVQRASLALGNGLPGLAVEELEEADRTAVSPALVKPQLLDLYCNIGQPEKALELLSSGDPNDPTLGGGEAGQSALRQARVYALLGNSENAAFLIQNHALLQLRYDRTIRALKEAEEYIQGDPQRATSLLLTVPGKVSTQANWEMELGMDLLEGGIPVADAGHPTGAADHFIKALTLAPDLTARPLLAYYLKAMGKTIPPSSAERDKDKGKPADKKK